MSFCDFKPHLPLISESYRICDSQTLGVPSKCVSTIMAVQVSALKCLQGLQMLSGTMEDIWTEDQLLRFNMWAANNSVFAPGHASMDYRLKDSPELEELMLDSLAVLERHLHREPATSVLLGRCLASPSSPKLQEPKSRSSSDRSDQLVRLTALIRKAGIRNRYAKASTYEEIYPDTGVNLTEEFKKRRRCYRWSSQSTSQPMPS